MERQLRDYASAVESANRELEAFSYSVSHDLRAPLRAIDGFSRILLEDHAISVTVEAARALERIRVNARRMGQLIDDLLAFSRLSRQPLRKEDVDPTTIVARVLEDLEEERSLAGVEVRVSQLPRCHADPALLQVLYVNLLSNAVKFSRGATPGLVEVGAETRNGEPAYFVKDYGVGFDMQFAGKLFGVFQRLHRSEEFEGTGVGLAIVQRVVHRHGGDVWAEAEVGRGATFRFTLGQEVADA
jgi:light-regulated signal transduction histidine kinase (bacteriophytochrome)